MEPSITLLAGATLISLASHPSPSSVNGENGAMHTVGGIGAEEQKGPLKSSGVPQRPAGICASIRPTISTLTYLTAHFSPDSFYADPDYPIDSYLS